MTAIPRQNWISGLLPTQPKTVVGLNNPQSRKVVAGKPVTASTPKPASKKQIMANFAVQLHSALEDRAKELSYLHRHAPFPVGLQQATVNLFTIVINKTDWIKKYKSTTINSVKSEAFDLLDKLGGLEKIIEKTVPANERGLMVCAVIVDLGDDVRHYARNINIIYNIINVQNASGLAVPLISNRPTNIEAKNQYAALIQAHQTKSQTAGFPKPAWIKRQMQLVGLPVSERTLRGWKTQIQNVTFDLFIQNKTGNK